MIVKQEAAWHTGAVLKVRGMQRLEGAISLAAASVLLTTMPAAAVGVHLLTASNACMKTIPKSAGVACKASSSRHATTSGCCWPA